MASGNWMARTTWLRFNRSFTPLSPRQPMRKIAGTMASQARDQPPHPGPDFQDMNPSITTCPASVPVIVLLCPLASNATANRTLAPRDAHQRSSACDTPPESSPHPR